MPSLTDEHLVWLIATIRAFGRARPHDPRDPWSVVLRRDDVVVSLDAPEGYDAVTTKLPDGPSFRIRFDERDRRAGRRFTLAHELAHIDLDNFLAGRDSWAAEHPDEYEHLEADTDRRAVELFDVDPPT